MKRALTLVLTLVLLLDLFGGMTPAAADETPYGEGTYVICYTPRPYGIQPDYIDFTIAVYSGDEQVGSWYDVKTEPIWEEKSTVRMAFAQTPTTVVFSCRYRTLDTEEYRPIECAVPFGECVNAHATALDAFGDEFTFAAYSIVEQVASYVDEHGIVRKRPDATLLTGTLDTLTDGWYYMGAGMKITKRLTVQGDVNLILMDGCAVILEGGLRLPAGSSLSVWGQAGDTGYLLCDASNVEDCAGIGGNDEESAGTLIVNGGAVRADGGAHAAGIGGGQYGYGGTVVVNGGSVYAVGGRVDLSLDSSGAGIGGGEDRDGGDVTVNGGMVYAEYGTGGAGIGGGAGGSQGGTVIVNGGIVTASGNYGAGIGGGKKDGGGGQGGTVIINGGTVTADSALGAAIGGGYEGTNGSITINGGMVTATNTTYTHSIGSAAIGAGGSAAQGGPIRINGGVVKAVSNGYGAGIGGGGKNEYREGYDGGVVEITNGIVTAQSYYGAGIGGGGSHGGGGGGSGGDISISGGIVGAVSVAKGAGIGGGNDGDGGHITISGGMVVAVGGYLDYSYLAENGHAKNSAKRAAKGLGGIPGVSGQMDAYAFEKIADLFLELVFSGEYGGAGIGGGDDGEGGTVVITGGSVFASAGMNTARAIGRGDGGDSDGSLQIYDTAMVLAGPDDEHVAAVLSDQRESAGLSNVYAEIVPCDHLDAALADVDWEKHLVACAYCVGTQTSVEEPHLFDDETQLCPCGHARHEVTVSVIGGGSGRIAYPEPVDAADGRIFVSAGDGFTLAVSPDQAGAYPTVQAKYGDAVLEPLDVQSADGEMIYAFSPMPDADVAITLGTEITSWADLQSAIASAPDGAELALSQSLTAQDSDGALYIPAEQSLILDLNGCALDRGLADGWNWRNDGNVITVAGSLTIRDSKGGGRITGGCNSGLLCGGGITVKNAAALTMTGGEVSGNYNNQSQGGGVLVENGGTFSVSGPVVIRDNGYGSERNDVALLGLDTCIDVVGPLDEAARIGVSLSLERVDGESRQVTRGLAGNGGIANFFSDEGDFVLKAGDEGEAYLWYICPVVTFDAAGGSGEMAPVMLAPNAEFTIPDCGFTAPEGRHFAGWWVRGLASEPIGPGDTIIVTDDIVLSAVWDLPHVHDGVVFSPWGGRNTLPRDGGAYYLLYDVKLDAGWQGSSWEIDDEIAICLNGRTIDMFDRTIGVWGNGSLSIFDEDDHGRVTGMRSSGGSCIYVSPNAVFNLHGGTVSGNTSGSLACIEADGTVNLYGGAITGNQTLSSAGEAGGAYVADGALRISGDVTVSGNALYDHAVNVRLPEGKVIDVIGPLSGSARIGVTADAQPAADAPVPITSGLSGNGSAENFMSDSSDFAIGVNRAGEAILGVPAAVTIDEGGLRRTATTACGGVWILPECDSPSFTGWQIDGQAELMQPGTAIDVAADLLLTAVFVEKPEFKSPDFTLPDSLAAIEDDAFAGIAATVIEVPAGCSSIGARAFSGCAHLEQIRIPGNCAVGEYAFAGCEDVQIFSSEGSPAQAYCLAHDNCTFVEE